MNKKIILLILSIFIVAVAAGSVIAAEAKVNTEIKMLSEKSLKNGDNIEFELKDAQGKPIASQKLNITFEANGKMENYSVVTDQNGKAYLVLYNEELGDHKVTADYAGDDHYNAAKLEETITIVEGTSDSEDTNDDSTASTVQYDNSTSKDSSSSGNSSSQSSSSDGELYYNAEYNFYYNSDGVIIGGQSDGMDAFETYMAYKEAESSGRTDLE